MTTTLVALAHLCSCTFASFQVYNTGEASDTIDSSASNAPDVKPATNLSIPVVP